MEIKTKFKIGETVWMMENNHPVKFNIYKIRAEIDSYNISVMYFERIYGLRPGDNFPDKVQSEKFLFATKEELIDSL